MTALITMISGLWNGVNSTTIYSDTNITFTIGQLLICIFLITIFCKFIKLIIVGKGDKADA